ncbi:MAG: FecR family protein, partial [Planctomycetota bacterium]|nr:FecR family protein [Planctomycetota bacterium]
MNEQHKAQLIEVTQKHLDGIANEQEVRWLSKLLESNSTACEIYLELQDIHAALTTNDTEDLTSNLSDNIQPRASDAKEGMEPSPKELQASQLSVPSRLPAFIALAVSVLILAIFSTYLLRAPSEESTLIRLKELSGQVTWIGNGGKMKSSLKPGDCLSGGTMELGAPDAHVSFTYEDGSSITLAGLSTLRISTSEGSKSQERQKTLHLKRGRLSATVNDQPHGKPMLIDTPSADLTVMGTRFNVETQPASTRLTVNTGKVHLRRNLDGQAVEVPAKQTVLATLEDQSRLQPTECPMATMDWSCDLRSDLSEGKWVSELTSLGIRLKKAVRSGKVTEESAIKQYKEAATIDGDTGSVWATASPVGALIVFSPSQTQAQPVILTKASRFRIK